MSFRIVLVITGYFAPMDDEIAFGLVRVGLPDPAQKRLSYFMDSRGCSCFEWECSHEFLSPSGVFTARLCVCRHHRPNTGGRAPSCFRGTGLRSTRDILPRRARGHSTQRSDVTHDRCPLRGRVDRAAWRQQECSVFQQSLHFGPVEWTELVNKPYPRLERRRPSDALSIPGIHMRPSHRVLPKVRLAKQLSFNVVDVWDTPCYSFGLSSRLSPLSVQRSCSKGHSHQDEGQYALNNDSPFGPAATAPVH